MIADTTTPLPTWLFAWFPVFFVGMWCFMGWSLSRIGGWHRLAQKYRTYQPATGKRLGWQSCGLGSVSYNSCLTMHVSDEGLHLAALPLFRIAHPPLFIPWSEFHQATTRRFFSSAWVTSEIGQPPLAKLRLNRKVCVGYEAQIGLVDSSA